MNMILKYIGIYILTILCFIGLLVLSALIPRENLTSNVKRSSEVLIEEGNKNKVFIPYRGYNIEFDNYSDSLMINTAYSIDTSTPLYSVLVARKNYIPNVTNEVFKDSVGELKSSSKFEEHDEVGELNDLVNNINNESFEYARYWHGYLIFLRPLLSTFNLLQIRLILRMLLILVVIVLIFFLYKKVDAITSIIYIMSLISVEYFYLYYSLHGIFNFIIALFFSIFILVKYDRVKSIGIVFFAIGMITNFFDLLTCPIISLCMPLLTYLLLEYKYKRYNYKSIIKIFLLWIIGYSLTWFTKWILVDLIYNRGLICISIKQVLYRTIPSKKTYSVLNVLLYNFRYEEIYIYVTIFINLLLQYISINIHKKKFNFNVKKLEIIKIILVDLFIAMVPIIVFILLQDHSIKHNFFTYRDLLITNLAINIIIIKICDIFFKEEKIII